MRGWQDDDLAAAAGLAAHLRAGGVLHPVYPPVALSPGEVAVADIPWCMVNAFMGAPVHYATTHNRSLHPAGLAMNLLVHMPLNEMSRASAHRAAAPRWRRWVDGRCTVTTQRILVDSGHRVYSWWYRGLARTEIDPAGLVLVYHGSDPAKFDTGAPWYLAVLVYYLAWHQVVDVPEPAPPPQRRHRHRRRH